jgi:hypothetical protein
MILLPLVASADPVYIDGLWYDYTNNGTEMEVVYHYSHKTLTNVVIPDEVTYMDVKYKVTSIGKNAFVYNWKITSVTIGNNVINIGEDAFQECKLLTSISIPNSVKNIGKGAFSWCTNLTSVTIGNSVTSIGEYAFYRCSGLTSVTIPNSVTSIGNRAFDGVDIPTVISLIENPFTIYGKTSDYRTFTQNTFNNATLYVPKGTIDKYKATDGWKDFNNIVEGNPTKIESIHSDSDKETSIYNLKGNKLEKPAKGINIINGKKVFVK